MRECGLCSGPLSELEERVSVKRKKYEGADAFQENMIYGVGEMSVKRKEYAVDPCRSSRRRASGK